MHIVRGMNVNPQKSVSVLIEDLWSQLQIPRKYLRLLIKDLDSLEKLAYQLSDPSNKYYSVLSKEYKQKILCFLKYFPKKLKVKPYTFITWVDKNYPKVFHLLYDPPLVFYYQGRLELLDSQQIKIAVVGTREATAYALDVTQNLIKKLSSFNPIIISGMAAGIDGTAHKTALECNIDSVGVLGTSLNRVYPIKHVKLQKRMAKQGLLISEISTGALHGPWRFIERNRLIAALADVIVVVEAPEKSGALSTVDFALQMGKEIFVVPGSILNKKNTGGHRLIQQGAHLLMDAEEILKNLGVQTAIQAKSSESQKKNIPTLNASYLTRSVNGLKEEEKWILDCLKGKKLHVNELIEKSQRPAPMPV